jgi:hypothetical protein
MNRTRKMNRIEKTSDEWKMAPASRHPTYTDKSLLQRKLESVLEGQPKGLKRMILQLTEPNKQRVADFLASFIAADNHKLKTRRVYVTNLVYLQRGYNGKNYLEITRDEMITYFQNKHSVSLTIGQEQGRFERWIGVPLHSRLFQFTNSYFIFKLPR